MTWERGLEVVVARTRHERLRWLRSHDNPDVEQRDAYRRLMVEQAGGNPAAMPPARTQAASLWRSLRAFVTSGGKLAPKSVRATRQAACNEVVIFSERPLISASDHDMIARIQPDFSTSD
jgi:hypothetical protein